LTGKTTNYVSPLHQLPSLYVSHFHPGIAAWFVRENGGSAAQVSTAAI
jgi:hypothetical protein